jgi:hypothetical protein
MTWPLRRAEYLGEISLGIALGILAQATSISVAMTGSSALVACAGVWVSRSPARSRTSGSNSRSV